MKENFMPLSPVMELEFEDESPHISKSSRPLRHTRALHESNSIVPGPLSKVPLACPEVDDSNLDDELLIGQALAARLIECNQRRTRNNVGAAEAPTGDRKATRVCSSRRNQNNESWAEKRASLRQRQQENIRKKEEQIEHENKKKLAAHYKKHETAGRHARTHSDRRRDKMRIQLQKQEARLLAVQEKRQDSESKHEERRQKCESAIIAEPCTARLIRQTRQHSALGEGEMAPPMFGDDHQESKHPMRRSSTTAADLGAAGGAQPVKRQTTRRWSVNDLPSFARPTASSAAAGSKHAKSKQQAEAETKRSKPARRLVTEAQTEAQRKAVERLSKAKPCAKTQASEDEQSKQQRQMWATAARRGSNDSPSTVKVNERRMLHAKQATGARVFTIAGTGSNFTDVRKVLTRRGWVESKVHQKNQVFDLKWTVGAGEVDYSSLLPHQLVNHFENTEVLVSKGQLCKSLRRLPWLGSTSSDKWFPRCYDMGDSGDAAQFMQDFRQSACINIILAYDQVADTSSVGQVADTSSVGHGGSRQKGGKDARVELSCRDFLSGLSEEGNLGSGFDSGEGGGGMDASGVTMPAGLVWLAMGECQRLLLQLRGEHEGVDYLEAQEVDKLMGQTLGSAADAASQRPSKHGWEVLLEYSESLFSKAADTTTQCKCEHRQFAGPSAGSQLSGARGRLVNRGVIPSVQKLRELKWAWKQRWESESVTQLVCGLKHPASCKEMRVEIRALLHALKHRLPQWSLNTGRNIWVVKPTDSSRGTGVTLSRSLTNIQTTCQGLSGRVVQKYIEKPLLMNGRTKFDVRLWVLVTSWSPLTIYVFHPFYLRLCSHEYSVDDDSLEDRYAHFSNYSIQKQASKFGTDSAENPEAASNVARQSTLQSYICELEGEHEGKRLWEQHLVPKMHELVRATLKSGLGLIRHRERSCELYGFDVMVDTEYDPYLLEVNLSPALNHRTPHLTVIIGKMVEGMLILTADAAHGTKADDQQRVQAAAALGWQCLYAEPAKIARHRSSGGCRQSLSSQGKERESALAVQGQGTSKQSMRVLERYTTVHHATSVIRRSVGEAARNRLLVRLLRRRMATRLQQCFRRHFRLRCTVVATVQRCWRGSQARLLVTGIRMARAAVKCQAQVRRLIYAAVARRLRLAKWAVVLQCWFKQLRALAAIKQARLERAAAVCCQALGRGFVFRLRRYHAQRRAAATAVQCAIRCLKARRLHQHLFQRKVASMTVNRGLNRIWRLRRLRWSMRCMRVQRCWRRWAGMRRLRSCWTTHKALIHCQSKWRALLRIYTSSAMVLQHFFSGRVTRLRFVAYLAEGAAIAQLEQKWRLVNVACTEQEECAARLAVPNKRQQEERSEEQDEGKKHARKMEVPPPLRPTAEGIVPPKRPRLDGRARASKTVCGSTAPGGRPSLNRASSKVGSKVGSKGTAKCTAPSVGAGECDEEKHDAAPRYSRPTQSHRVRRTVRAKTTTSGSGDGGQKAARKHRRPTTGGTRRGSGSSSSSSSGGGGGTLMAPTMQESQHDPQSKVRTQERQGRSTRKRKPRARSNQQPAMEAVQDADAGEDVDADVLPSWGDALGTEKAVRFSASTGGLDDDPRLAQEETELSEFSPGNHASELLRWLDGYMAAPSTGADQQHAQQPHAHETAEKHSRNRRAGALQERQRAARRRQVRDRQLAQPVRKSRAAEMAAAVVQTGNFA
jgi:tubulin monoglycylase TTLL3/8